ncbi:MAG: hypothetical protein RL662_999 [Bacteroidota bacterium]|jgi:uncharacterized protein YbjT (DUF2867 family)
MTTNKKAIILGASGLVGSSLLQLLLDSPIYAQVVIFVRKDIGINHSKLVTHIIDFDQPQTYQDKVVGDELFCCLGTTAKQARSDEAFRKVDFDYPVQFAQLAQQNEVQHYLFVSSIGADKDASTFYLRTKGECEIAIMRAAIYATSIFRPSLLSGDRKEFRWGEKIALLVLKTFSRLLIGKFKKYKHIPSTQVALAMYAVAQQGKAALSIYESDEIQAIRKID